MSTVFDWLKRGGDFFLFSSFFIALCSVVMCWQTFYLFQLEAQIPFLFFVFFATLSSYNFHWYFTHSEVTGSDKVRWSFQNKKFHLVFFIASTIVTSYFLWQLRDFWQWLLVTAFFTFLYSAPKIPCRPFLWLRKIAVGKTIFLAFAWTHVTAILPIIIGNQEFSAASETFAVQQFFFLYPICILFDHRDRQQDITDGIRSLINQLNEKGIDIVFRGSVLVSYASLILLSRFFASWQILILTLPPGILVLLYRKAKNKGSDYLFYFILDGLMMLSGLLFLLFSFI